MALETLHDLMVDQLKDLYNAERQVLSALPKLARNADTTALRNALDDHRRQTETHVARLEEAFALLGEPARGKTCKGMEGLLAEGKEMLEQDGDGAVKDAGIIAAAQRVEHYEIAGYGCAINFAGLLGHNDVAQLLGTTLDEEKAANDTLTTLAESDINPRALHSKAGGDGHARKVRL
jgi:ferritin-like metal-binding protein YciE